MEAIAVNNFSTGEVEGRSLTSAWTAFQDDLRALFAEDVYRTWFEDLKPLREGDRALILSTPNEFTSIWVRDNYGMLLERHFSQKVGQEVRITLESSSEPGHEQPLRSEAPQKVAQRKLVAMRKFDEAHFISPKNTFENFVVGPGNQLAHATCIAVAREPGTAYSPLFLYGATGMGKTHLLQAVAHEALARRPKLKIVYTSTEKFTNEFIAAVQAGALGKFRSYFRKVDVLLIDDIHFLAGKERIQEEFFHTFNELFESQKQICLCSDRPAVEIAQLETRLVSRFQWGFAADIQPPDLETRIAILQKKAEAMRLQLPADVAHALANGVCSNVRRLEGALNRVAGYVSLTHQPITVAAVQNLMHDIFQEEASRTLQIEQIQRRVAEFYKITLADLLGKKRPSNIAFPRQVAMYLSRALTTYSLQRIGTEFGGREHGTVIHACKAVENAMKQSETTTEEVEALKRLLTQ
ncbi:MAG: chromosomal replication initiator protein DnaA [Puniceicoccales bacterium]|jgi:chromosomal replication initiator protein|nr:chromosomal replication initiator protein DnaA [Puniceicoccales bacterium]